MHKYEISILRALKGQGKLSFDALMEVSGLGRDEAMWALQNLLSGGMVEAKKSQREEASLTAEGAEYASRGLPERALIERLRKGHEEIGRLAGKDGQIGFMWAKKKGLVAIEKGRVELTAKGKEALGKELHEERVLKEIAAGEYSKYAKTEAAAEFRKRGLLESRTREEIGDVCITEKGVRAIGGVKEVEAEADLIENVDRGVIKGRLWEKKGFRPYNIAAPVESRDVAMRHPLRRVIEDIRASYLSMGFTEVSGPIIEPAFWVFDHLFMPQDHPAREVMDTFFLSNPRTIPVTDKKLMARIKREHEKAWRIGWSEGIATQAVARPHTTSVTARYMYALLKEIQADPKKHELPIKLFTIGRNFRNENIDYKHMADFYQTDGIIIGRNLTLANLFDTLIKLYKGIGVKVKFVPLYYPFVEPGVNVRINVNGEWMEMGGAGIIRREVTGVSRKTINVLAWGLALERLMFIRDKELKTITSLYNSRVGWLRESSIR